MLLRMHNGIIYGPIQSRRLGRSLGINLSPAEKKLCSFNCIYCHYGWTQRLSTDFEPYRKDLPARKDVYTAVEKSLQSSLGFDYITFSGNGEPSLHPDFPDIVDDVIALRDRYRPEAKTGLLSNSTGLVHEPVRKAASKIDFPMFKLDAGTEQTFTAINRPAKGVEFGAIVHNLVSMSNILIQSVLVDGDPSNITEDELDAYFELLRLIKPREVHVYSIDRPVPKMDIKLVPPEDLDRIAEEGRKRTGIPIIAFYPG
jgi:wyosine [tRNA(Phe)-imidazoG37] synthetase (radical SAM superfamily)